MWEANRIGMCLPQLKEVRRTGGDGCPPGALEWLRMRHDTDCARFAALLGRESLFHGNQAGVGDCAIWGYTQWLKTAGVQAMPPMAGWLDRMRALPGMKTPDACFPAGQTP